MNAEDMSMLSACFALPENMAITAVHPTALTLTIDLACSDATACYPLCHQFSERMHSIYQRKVADVPCEGRRVLLLLTVRKFIVAKANGLTLGWRMCERVRSVNSREWSVALRKIKRLSW